MYRRYLDDKRKEELKIQTVFSALKYFLFF